MKTRKTLIVRVTGLRRTVPRTMETGLVFFFFFDYFYVYPPRGKKKIPSRTDFRNVCSFRRSVYSK